MTEIVPGEQVDIIGRRRRVYSRVHLGNNIHAGQAAIGVQVTGGRRPRG